MSNGSTVQFDRTASGSATRALGLGLGFWERDSCVRAILDARGEARLADFGLARVAKQRAGTDATVASVSAVCGTAAFLDPI